MKCSEGMLTFKGEPPGPELFKVTVDNGGGPVDLQVRANPTLTLTLILTRTRTLTLTLTLT